METQRLVWLVFLTSLPSFRGDILRCRRNQWQCDDGSCISHDWRCDGGGDCLDGSDERDCAEPPNISACPPGQFACGDSVGCFNESARCDGKRQCPNGSDEENCSVNNACLELDWTCLNHICIPQQLRCNGENDCMDESDEQGCGPCDQTSLRCPGGMCVTAEERCDGKVHCSDGRDEPATCGRRCSVANGGCSHVCVDEPWGALCSCPAGFRISTNGAVCEDVDECARPFSPCVHLCINTVGSYLCHCREGFVLSDNTKCLAKGSPTRLLTIQKRSIVLFNLKSQEFELVQTPKSAPVTLTFDKARGWYYWADSKGSIYKTDGQHSQMLYSADPGINSLACDWLDGQLYWTNQKTEALYFGASDGSGYTSLLSKHVSPSELVLLPLESSMFWINVGPGDRVTLEKSWMDGSDRSPLVVLTAQSPYGLSLDVASRRLFWISSFKKSIETVKVDGSGRYSFPGVFTGKPALGLAVFETWFYWVDDYGLWRTPQNEPSQRKLLRKAFPPVLKVSHELQQPKGSSACMKTPCQLCMLTKANPVGFTCACPNSKVLMPDRTCEYPRFAYTTMTTIHLLEFKGRDVVKTVLFTTDQGILSFDLDWYRDWLYWVNKSGLIQRTSLASGKSEVVPALFSVCLIRLDQRTAILYWVSCDKSYIGITTPDGGHPQQLYRTGSQIRDLHLDWLRGRLFWQEAQFILVMSLLGGETKEVLNLGKGFTENMAFDLRADSLLWNSPNTGLSTMSLLQGKAHVGGRRWDISGPVVAAFEPFLLSLLGDVLILWDQRDGNRLKEVTLESGVFNVITALKDVKPVPDVPVCHAPLVLCPGSSVCHSLAQLCDGRKDCPDGFDEELCFTTCPLKGDFKCADRRGCIPRPQVCDGRAHCHDGSDELNCPFPTPHMPLTEALRCRKGSKPCSDGSECVLYTHVCDGDADCKDGSDEAECEEPQQNATAPTSLDVITPQRTRLPSVSSGKQPIPQTCEPPSVPCPDVRVLVCISQNQFCDGRKDCPDGSDEKCVKKCSSRSDFRCKDRRSCVSKRLLCDGRAHCHDGSDELNCATVTTPAVQSEVLKCRRGSILCGNGQQCVLAHHKCDGEVDCQDGSDEQDCETSETAATPSGTSAPPIQATTLPQPKPSCPSASVLCPGSSLCISQTQLCDGKRDCPDGSDEDCVKTCPNKTDFLCKDRRSCVGAGLVCDGQSQCHDGSDELNCSPTVAPTVREEAIKCQKGSKLCNDGSECVLYTHLCDGERDCVDGSDEEGCQSTCQQGEFQCAHGKMCIPLNEVCDGRSQCQDRSDEQDCWTPTRTCQHRCDGNRRCIPLTFLCDGEMDCRDGTDEDGCAPNTSNVIESPDSYNQSACVSPSVLCRDASLCVSLDQLCDGRADCPDQSDEEGCTVLCKNSDDFLCKDGSRCVPKSEVCDGRANCPDGSDERRCASQNVSESVSSAPLKCRVGSKPCKDGRSCVSFSHTCDGEQDCQDGSDEEGCEAQCRAEEFPCAHGNRCIPAHQVCDGTAHCQDGSDEADCLSLSDSCRHHCDNNSRCVPETFLCDGERDCADGSDEKKCGLVSCGISQFRCVSGQCVSDALRCDGYADCRDRSDELGCSRPVHCPPNLRCPNSHQCLQKEWFCDGENDCKDGSDEKNCVLPPVKCREYQWRCGESSQCIPLSWKCDGTKDCLNNLDEEECGRAKCATPLYQCGSGECLDPALVCNGVTNCADSFDEGNGCLQHSCSSPAAPKCDHDCVSTPYGLRCTCRTGFRLQSNGLTCADVDECNELKEVVCEHICLNTQGSYLCHCHLGYVLELDNKSCKTTDEAMLLASVQSELLVLGVHSLALRLLSSANRPVFALDYHWAQQRIYWLSPDYQSIRWIDIDGSKKGTLVKGVKSDSIAVDWIGKNLYWVDGLVGQILAVPLGETLIKPQNYTVVLDEDFEQPSTLVLLPHKGLLLWAEIGSTPQIKKAGMDGSNREVLVSHSLSWPVSLTFDHLENRVYWADEKMHCIGSVSLFQDNVKILQLAETPSPFSVAVFNDKIFWSDTKRRTIRSANKKSGKNQKILLKRPGQPFGLKLMHPFSQPVVPSPCDHKRCSHICLLAPDSQTRSGAYSGSGLRAVCRCPAGLFLSKDKVTCSSPTESAFILLLSPTAISQIYLHTMPDSVPLKTWPSSRVLTLPGVTEANSLDVTINDFSLYVADMGQGSVDLFKLTGSRSRQGLTFVRNILKQKGDRVLALAVDWVTFNLYWSSAQMPDLHVTSHSGHSASLLQGSLKGTTSIAVFPPSGRVCYTAKDEVNGNSQAQVYCSYMDGRSPAVLWKKSNVPISLVFSNEGAVIYWADIGKSGICSIGMDGSGYKLFQTGPGLLASFARTDNMLLWVTHNKEVSRLWFSDGIQPKKLWFSAKSKIVSIKAYGKGSQTGTNTCSIENGKCSQLCLPFPGGHTCKCGRGFFPVNHTSCAPLHECPSGLTTCRDSSECVPSAKLCDGTVDCVDQSDEQDCPGVNLTLASVPVSQQGPPGRTISDSGAPVQKTGKSCSLQNCNGHGRCVTEGSGISCHCDGGFKGEFCQEEGEKDYTSSIVWGTLFAVAGLSGILYIVVRKRIINFDGSRDAPVDKDRLLALSEVFRSEPLDSDSEEIVVDSQSVQSDGGNLPVELPLSRHP